MTESVKTIQQYIDEGQGLVRSLASKIHHNIPVPVDFEDLVAYGQVGLAEAAREFDPEEGCLFTTFAYYRIRGAMYDGLSKMSWSSRARYNKLRYDQMANETLRQSQEQATENSAENEASGSGVRNDAEWFRGMTRKLGVVYLSTQGSGEDDDRQEFVDRDPSPQAMIASREISDKLRALVETLPPVERSLINNVYFDGTTLQDAADRVGISKSWASRLHVKALEQLAKSLRSCGIDG